MEASSGWIFALTACALLPGCTRNNPLFGEMAGGSSSTDVMSGSTGVMPGSTGVVSGSTGVMPGSTGVETEDFPEAQRVILYASEPVLGSFGSNDANISASAVANEICVLDSDFTCSMVSAIIFDDALPIEDQLSIYLGAAPGVPVTGPEGIFIAYGLSEFLVETSVVDLFEAGVADEETSQFWLGLNEQFEIDRNCMDWRAGNAMGEAIDPLYVSTQRSCMQEHHLLCMCLAPG